MLGRAVDVDLGDLDRWCHANLQTGVARIIFQEGYLSTVVGAETTSGGQVVVKIRRPAERLEACGLAHRRLFDAGFACPEPLVGLEPFGPFVASAETLISGGARWPDSGRAPDPFAQALAALMAAAPAPSEVPTLEPPLPWTGPDRQQQGLWPSPDDRDVDLNAIDGPDWLDEAGRVARSRFEKTGDHRRRPRRLVYRQSALVRAGTSRRLGLGQRHRSQRGLDRRSGRSDLSRHGAWHRGHDRGNRGFPERLPGGQGPDLQRRRDTPGLGCWALEPQLRCQETDGYRRRTPIPQSRRSPRTPASI